MNVYEAEKLILNMPKVQLGFFPTPLQKLENLSKKYNASLYMKRDDLSGPEFGGNKIRKLEFLLADAINKKAEYVFTYGAHQSNHCRETVAACRKLGLKPVIYLLYLGSSDKPSEYRGNLFLDKIMGAEIKYVAPTPGMSAYEAVEESYKISARHIFQLEESGHRCYDIPVGGFNPTGCLGFALGFVELAKQLQEKSIRLDYIVSATGSGGTLAGLLVGKAILNSDINIISVSVDEEKEGKLKKITDMANEVLKILKIDKSINEDEAIMDTGYIGEGYEKPSEASTSAIRELAIEEGIILDPVYTGKAFAGFLDYLKKGVIPQGSNALFWHTGGTPAIFAEKEIVGQIDA
jgi:D-cysteine desulfhydrase family pyridoxal phosphate-dependent enzyme